MTKAMTVRKPDTLDDIKESDLVQLTRKLLDRMVESTSMLEIEEMSPEKLKEARLVLSYLNATNAVIKTKMNFFRMIGLGDKIRAIRKKSSTL